MTFVVGDVRDVIASDHKLKDMLQALANMNAYDITVNLETRMYISILFLVSRLTDYVAQRAFTDYTFPMACSLFGLPEDPRRFSPFSFGKYSLVTDGTGTPFDTAASNAFKHLITDLQIRHGSISLNLSNEATCSEFIPLFLIAVSSIFTDIVVNPQRPVHGRYGRGPVDFALEVSTSGVILGITEVKREDFRRGVAQNLVQLESSLSSRKRKSSEISGDPSIGDGEAKVFGLVTGAKEWWALECAMDKIENLSFECRQ